jgi:hypothetical protein
VRVGSDGQLYQLRSSRTAGVSIARYSLTPISHVPPPPHLPRRHQPRPDREPATGA